MEIFFMKHFLFLLLVTGLSFAVHAEKGQSIMFSNPDPLYTAEKPDTAADKHAALCKKLKQQMKDLEGSPLRRNPVVRRYKIECTEIQNQPGTLPYTQ